ncbi:hypothetical protein [uncultured Cetobacterium sp.]|uniref:hypothetical protein n=1 Tax=uncultured Cetobacterium sp. TaxID=527638 RepID=UPI002627C281|nr:hypothetical protein [uncultured Cetobacterium sp.]
MKKISLFLILSSLVLSLTSCSNADLENISKALAETNSTATGNKPSEMIRNTAVENAILEAYNLQRGVDTVYYYYTKVDLNGDNIPEYFIYAYGPELSGSGGGSALILSNNFKEISRFTLVRTPITISRNKTRGWKDIIMQVSGGGANPSTVAMKFNGESYPSNPSTQPALSPNDYVDGTRIFTENMSVNRGLKIE